MYREIQGRPALGLLSSLLVGLTCPLHPVNLFFLVPVAALFIPLRPLQWSRALWLLLAFFGGLVLAPTLATPVDQASAFEGSATIISAPMLYPEASRFDVETDRGRFVTSVEGHPFLAYGEVIQVNGLVKPLWVGSEDSHRLRGMIGRLRVREWSQLQPASIAFRWAEVVRRSFMEFASATLPPKQATTIEAICFNVDTMLDDETEAKLRKTGTVHIVSASGLHVLALAIALLWTLSRVPIPRTAQLLTAAAVLTFYALATGMNPPVVRAVLMALIGFFAYVFKRDPDALSALGISAIAFLIWQPWSVYGIGFQLSFITVGAFALFLDRHEDRTRLVRSSKMFVQPARDLLADARAALMASLVATCVSAPVVAYHFGSVSVVGLLANLLILLVVPATIVGAMLLFLLSFISPWIAALGMKWLVNGWLGWLYLVIDVGSAPRWSVLQIPEFNPYWLTLAYGALMLTWRPRVIQP